MAIETRTLMQLIKDGFTKFQMCEKPGAIMPGLAIRGTDFEDGDVIALYGQQCVEVRTSPLLKKSATSDPDITIYTYEVK